MPSDPVQVACPACLTANRVPAARLGEDPKCGKCGAVVRPVPRDGAAVRARGARAEGPRAAGQGQHRGSAGARRGIRAIPTLALFRNGVEVKRVSGALDAGSLVKWAG